MSLRPEHVVEWLRTLNMGVIGKTLFAQAMPSDCVNGIVVLSPVAPPDIDWELPGHYRGRMQIIVRATTYNAGYEKANAIFHSLNKDQSWWKISSGIPSIPPATISRFKPRHPPIAFGLNEANVREFSLNFDYICLLTS